MVKLGDKPVSTFSLRSWRKLIGYVSQESPLLAGTIAENLTYGLDRDVSMEEMRAAAAMAYADGFIDELPEGYNTDVGERGVKLSMDSGNVLLLLERCCGIQRFLCLMRRPPVWIANQRP